MSTTNVSYDFASNFRDDLIYLVQFYEVFTTHPFRQPYKPLFEPSLTRVMACLAAASLEQVIKENFNVETPAEFEAEIKNLGKAPPKKIMIDYEGLRELRNLIMHANFIHRNPKKDRSQMIKDAGLEAVPAKLTMSDFQRVMEIHDTTIGYIFGDLKGDIPQAVVRSLAPRNQTTGFHTDLHTMRLFQVNLERIDECIDREEKLDDDIGIKAIEWHKKAMMNWISHFKLDGIEIAEACKTARSLLGKKIDMRLPFSAFVKMLEEIPDSLIAQFETCAGGPLGVTPKDLLGVFKIEDAARHLVRNISCVRLFSHKLPKYFPKTQVEFHTAAHELLNVFEIEEICNVVFCGSAMTPKIAELRAIIGDT
jgi:hypothetical protein